MAACTPSPQQTPPLHAPEAHWEDELHMWPGSLPQVPARVRVVGSPEPGSTPHAVHTPVGPQAVHAPGVPATQHTPPTQNPLAHCSPNRHGAPTTAGAAHTPSGDSWVPAPHRPPAQRPSRRLEALRWAQEVHAAPMLAAQHRLDRQSPDTQSLPLPQYCPDPSLHTPAGVREYRSRHAVHAPLGALQDVHVAVVPAAQQTPPPHTPLAHSWGAVQGVPAPWGMMHVPVVVITCPEGQLPASHSPSCWSVAFRCAQLVQAAPIPGAQHTYSLQSWEAHSSLCSGTHDAPASLTQAPVAVTVVGLLYTSKPHCVHLAPSSPHAVHAEEVPGAQHRPPAHTPLTHSAPTAHAAPEAWGATHSPVADTAVPIGHPVHRPRHAPVVVALAPSK